MNDPVVLLVQAVDPVGSEGIGGDLRVLAELDCAARLAVTAVVGPGASGRHRVPDELIAAQIRDAWSDRPPAAVRTGGFAEPSQVERVAGRLLEFHASQIVVGYEPGTRVPESRRAMADALAEHLVPIARVLVLRAGFAEDWGISPVEDLDSARRAAAAARARGAGAVLVTGVFEGGRVLDVLEDGDRTAVIDGPRIHTTRVEGIGVAHATALAAHLARGLPLERAAAAAQRYVGMRLSEGR